MEKVGSDFLIKFRLDELFISNTGSWVISLRPQQPTIGSLVLTLNRKCERLSQITPDEARGLSEAFKEIERFLDKTFKPEKINYLSLMMIDNQVHFHVIPRYSKKIKIGKKEFKDKNWPGPPVMKELEITPSELLFILNRFRDAQNPKINN